MVYQMAATAVSLNDLEGHSPVAICRTFVQHFVHDFNGQCTRTVPLN